MSKTAIATKPRICWLKITQRWICRAGSENWLGQGQTPAEAYANWFDGLAPWAQQALRRYGRAP